MDAGKAKLLPQREEDAAPPAAAAAPGAAESPVSLRVLSVMNKVALACLTVNTLVGAYNARSDPWTLAFVVAAYAALILFFWSLRAYEAAPPGRKGPMKALVFALAMFLIFIFAYKVSSMMPFGFAVAVWAMAGVTTTAGFYCVFFMEGPDANAETGKLEGRKMTVKSQQL